MDQKIRIQTKTEPQKNKHVIKPTNQPPGIKLGNGGLYGVGFYYYQKKKLSFATCLILCNYKCFIQLQNVECNYFFKVAYDMCNCIKQVAKDNFPYIYIYIYIYILRDLFLIDWKLMTCDFSIVHSTKRKQLNIVIYNQKKKRRNFQNKKKIHCHLKLLWTTTNSCVYLWMWEFSNWKNSCVYLWMWEISNWNHT